MPSKYYQNQLLLISDARGYCYVHQRFCFVWHVRLYPADGGTFRLYRYLITRTRQHFLANLSYRLAFSQRIKVTRATTWPAQLKSCHTNDATSLKQCYYSAQLAYSMLSAFNFTFNKATLQKNNTYTGVIFSIFKTQRNATQHNLIVHKAMPCWWDNF